MLDLLLWGTVALVWVREVVGFLERRRSANFDAQYDLRYVYEPEPIEDTFSRHATIDWLTLTKLVCSKSDVYSEARVFALRRFSASHWEFRETDQSWAAWVGGLRESQNAGLDLRLAGESAERDPTWSAFHPEVTAKLEADYSAFLDGFDIGGPCGSSDRLTRELFRAAAARRRLELEKNARGGTKSAVQVAA